MRNRLLLIFCLCIYGLPFFQAAAGAAVPYPVPHRSWIKLGAVAYQDTMTQAQIDWASAHIDWLDGPYSKFLAQYKADTNAPILLYDNYYCLYVSGGKYNSLVSYVNAHGLNLEDMFLHFAVPTTIAFGSETHTLPAGSRVPSYNWYGTGGDLTKNGARVIMNANNADYRAFNAPYELSLVNAQYGGVTFDGVFVDNSLTGVVENNCGDISSGGTFAEYPGKTRAQAAAAYDSDLVLAFAAVRSVFGPKGAPGSKLQVPNGAQGWTALYPTIDQTFEEYRVQPQSSGFWSWGNFGDWLGAQAASDAAGLPTIVSAVGLGSSATDNVQQKLFALAAYYIGANPTLDYFCRQDSNAGDLQTHAWFGAVEYNVGAPQAAYSTVQSGNDSGGSDYIVYGRSYANALMLVRVSVHNQTAGAPVTVNLPKPGDNPTGTYYSLNVDGTLGSAITQINLTNAQGIILIKASSLQPSVPTASFTGTPASGPSPLTVQFTDTSAGLPTSWTWTFGDGATSTAQNPSHMYASAGSFTVVLIASNSLGSNTVTQTGYIAVSSGGSATPPSITTQPSNVTVNPGQSVAFTITASGTAPLTYQWQKNTTNIAGATAATYTITSVASGDAGSYRCVVTNTAGSATSNSATLTVNPGNSSPNPPPPPPPTPPNPPNPPGPSPISPIASDVGPERNVIHPSIGSGAIINFTCDKPTNVEINIYSRQGRVKGPIQGECVAGTNGFSWDGRNEDGGKVASGIYLVKIKVGDKFLTKKVAVLR